MQRFYALIHTHLATLFLASFGCFLSLGAQIMSKMSDYDLLSVLGDFLHEITIDIYRMLGV